jgi:TRAP-type C4-dicarboxylate transport system substrate-binding protein
VIVKSALLFADRVRAKTNGGLDIKVVYGGALGGKKENFEAIMTCGGSTWRCPGCCPFRA